METKEILQIFTNELGISGRESGRNIFFSCPFHEDKTPSLSFEKQKKFFTCFSCGFKAKDIFVFWSKLKKISFKETVYQLSELGYIEKVNINKNFEEEDNLTKILELTSEIYQYNLFTEKGSDQLEYLKEERGLSDSIIERFSLGTSIFNDQLSSLLLRRGSRYSISEIADTMLVHFLDSGEAIDFFWSKQIIFPIRDENGKLVFFASRNLDQQRENKYIFLPGKSIKKSTVIYNYKFVSESTKNFCYLVEGFFDVISLTKVGFENTISLLGTSVSVDQVKLLRKLAKKIIIFFDGDQAGTEASIKTAVLLSLNDIECEVIEHKNNLDPDEICRLGGEEIAETLARKRNPILFTIRHYFERMKIEENPQLVKNFVSKISEFFQQFRKNVQTFVIKKISVITGMTVDETRYLYTSNIKNLDVRGFSPVNENEFIEQSVIYYAGRDRNFWELLKKQKPVFFVEKNQGLSQIVNNFYDQNPLADKFRDFENMEEFWELPIIDEDQHQKTRVLESFLKRKSQNYTE